MAQPPLSPKLGTQVAHFPWAEYTFCLWMSFDCCWQINGRDLPRPVSCNGKDLLWPVTTNPYPPWRINCAGAGWWCSDLVCSCPLVVLALGFPGWCRPRSAPTCVSPGATLPELWSNLRWLLLVLGLEIHWQSQAVNPDWLLLVPGLGSLSKSGAGGSLRAAIACLKEFRKL